MADLVDFLDETLSGSVCRVRLSGIEELYRIVGVVDYLGETFEVGEEKVCPLVCCKATSESDEEGVGVNLVHQAYHPRRVALVLQPAIAELSPDMVYELGLKGHAGFPYFLVADVVYGLPD